MNPKEWFKTVRKFGVDSDEYWKLSNNEPWDKFLFSSYSTMSNLLIGGLMYGVLVGVLPYLTGALEGTGVYGSPSTLAAMASLGGLMSYFMLGLVAIPLLIFCSLGAALLANTQINTEKIELYHVYSRSLPIPLTIVLIPIINIIAPLLHLYIAFKGFKMQNLDTKKSISLALPVVIITTPLALYWTLNHTIFLA